MRKAGLTESLFKSGFYQLALMTSLLFKKFGPFNDNNVAVLSKCLNQIE